MPPTRSTGPGLNLTADTSLSLSLTIALPEGAPAGLLNYVLRAVPSGLDLFELPTITENDYLIEVSSTGETTFSQTLAGDQLDQLSLRFPQLVNAHPQTFVLNFSRVVEWARLRSSGRSKQARRRAVGARSRVPIRRDSTVGYPSAITF